MILTAALLLISSSLQAPNDAVSIEWTKAMASSKLAKNSPLVKQIQKVLGQPVKPTPPAKAASRQARSHVNSSLIGGSSFASPGVVVVSANPTPISPEWLAQLQARNDAQLRERNECLELGRKGVTVGTVLRLKKDFFADPSFEYIRAILDLDFWRGDYTDAYKVAAGAIDYQPYSGTGDPISLRACLASSSLGEVYPGQKEFCLRANGAVDPDGELAKVLPKGDTPDEVASLASISIGVRASGEGFYDDAIWYLQNALKLHPSNPAASYWLADAYSNKFQYSNAIAVVEEGLTHIDNGNLYHALKSGLRRLKYNLKKFGDGVSSLPPAGPAKSTKPMP